MARVVVWVVGWDGRVVMALSPSPNHPPNLAPSQAPNLAPNLSPNLALNLAPTSRSHLACISAGVYSTIMRLSLSHDDG